MSLMRTNLPARDNLQDAPGDILHQTMEEELKPYLATAKRRIIDGLTAKGFVLTRELLDSVYTTSKSLENGLVAELELGFRGYGRFKDLKAMQAGMNVEALVAFVDKVGLSKFGFVPGYFTDAKRRRPIDPTRAKLRIALGIGFARIRKGTLRRKGKGFFNPVKGKLEYAVMYAISRNMATGISAEVKNLVDTLSDDDNNS